MLNLKSGAYSWIYGGMFVGALAAVVAIATVSGRPSAEAKPSPDAAEPKSGDISSDLATAVDNANLNSVKWAPSFEEAMQRARVEKKPILIDFYTDWCSACKTFNREVLPKKDVIKESGNWIAVHINAEKRQDVAQAYGVTGYPTFIFAENTGKPLAVLPGYAPDIDFAKLMRDTRLKYEKQGA